MANKTKKDLENELILLQEENDKLKDEKKHFDRAVAYAELLKSGVVVNDVKSTSNLRSTSYSNYTKENIESYIRNPSSNEKNLRNASKYMYDVSLHYRRLIKYYANLGNWDYVLYPVSNIAEISPKKVKKGYLEISKQLDKMNIKHEMIKDNEIALKEGAFYGIVVEDDDSFFINQIDADLCKITSMDDACWNYAIDCSQIKENELNSGYYPDVVSNLYKEYQKTGIKYQEVPREVSFCLKPDETSKGYTVPMFSSIMGKLYLIKSYEELQETSSEIDNYKLINAIIPTDSDGVPLFDEVLAKQYYYHLCNSLPPFIGLSMTPFELQDFKFDKSEGINSIDVTSRAVEQLWQEAGTPAAIHGAGKATATGIKYATKVDEQIAIQLMLQSQRAINRFLRLKDTDVVFSIEFLPTTTFNRDDWIGYFKESSSLGIGKSQYAAALGISPYKISKFDYMEQEFMGFDLLKPLISSYNAPSEVVVGRPETKNPSEKTINNKEAET